MKTLGIVVICLAVGFACGFKTALVREHSRLERNNQIVSRMFKEVWSNTDSNSALSVADELFTSDFVLHDWTGDSYGLRITRKA